jgi:hypothetical protein
MLSLTNIHKTFQNGEEVVTALNDVSIDLWLLWAVRVQVNQR